MLIQTLSKVVPLPCVKRVFYETDEQEAAALHAEFRCCSDVFHLITCLLDGLSTPFPCIKPHHILGASC